MSAFSLLLADGEQVVLRIQCVSSELPGPLANFDG